MFKKIIFFKITLCKYVGTLKIESTFLSVLDGLTSNGDRRSNLMQKTNIQKSCDTVPLRDDLFDLTNFTYRWLEGGSAALAEVHSQAPSDWILPAQRYAGTGVHMYTDTEVHRNTCTQVCRYGTLVHRYRGTYVHRSTGRQVNR